MDTEGTQRPEERWSLVQSVLETTWLHDFEYWLRQSKQWQLDHPLVLPFNWKRDRGDDTKC